MLTLAPFPLEDGIILNCVKPSSPLSNKSVQLHHRRLHPPEMKQKLYILGPELTSQLFFGLRNNFRLETFT